MATDKQRPSKISKEARTLFFALLRAALHPGETREKKPLDTPSAACWAEVVRLASEQGVTAILHDGVERLAQRGVLAPEAMPPRTLRLQWALNAERIEQKYDRQRRVIGRLAKLFHAHGIRMMVLKGYGLSLDYPRPEHRPCGDIDMWLYGKQAEADELLRREWSTKIEVDVHHHTTFVLDGVLVENHFDFLNIHSHLSNRVIEAELQRLAPLAGEEIEVDGAPVSLPSAQFNALFLLRHAAMHFAAVEIGMRHIVDWALFIKRHHAEIDWEALHAIARRMNMHRFLDATNALSADLLGLDASLLPAIRRDAALENRIIDDILSPEFAEQAPKNCGLVRRIWFRTRRWWANRWKHRIVYNEGLLWTFLVQVRSHLMKPKSLR